MERAVTLSDGRQITLRHVLTPGDAGRIIKFHGVVYAWEHQLGAKFEGYVAATVGEFAVRYDPEGSRERVWLASPRGEKELIGCCALLDAGISGAQFRWFLIDPSFRRVGLGKLLLGEAVEFARLSGYPRMFLYTSDFLPPAAKLYENMGFELVDEIPRTDWEVPFMEQKYMLEFA